MKRYFFAGLSLLLCATLFAQSASDSSVQATPNAQELPIDRGAAGLWQALKKLHTRASLIMVTAHPDDEDGGMLAYESENSFVIFCVRRVKENDMEWLCLMLDVSPQKLRRFGGYDLDLRSCNLQRIDISCDERRHCSRSIDKDNARRAARQRFDSDRARSRTQIQKSCALDSRREDVEERLAQSIGRRSRLDRRRAF